jgi:hypothetical protein
MVPSSALTPKRDPNCIFDLQHQKGSRPSAPTLRETRSGKEASNGQTRMFSLVLAQFQITRGKSKLRWQIPTECATFIWLHTNECVLCSAFGVCDVQILALPVHYE